MTRVVFITTKKQEDSTRPYSHLVTDIRVYIVRDDKKFLRMTQWVNLCSDNGRSILEEVCARLGVIELEHHIETVSAVWETEKVFEAKKSE